MNLSPGEKSILAYFNNDAVAIQAAEELRRRGLQDLQVSRVSSFSGFTASRSGTSLSGLVLSSGEYGNWGYDLARSPLLAADPSVSGMAGALTPAGYNTLLTVVSPESNAAEVKALLREYGAAV